MSPPRYRHLLTFSCLDNQIKSVHKISGTSSLMHEKSRHENFMRGILVFMLENTIFMHDKNDIPMHETRYLGPGMIVLPQKIAWAVGLYTSSCKEFSPLKIFGQISIFMHKNIIFNGWKFHFQALKFHLHDFKCHSYA